LECSRSEEYRATYTNLTIPSVPKYILLFSLFLY
jgi:hypothetical protein